jgi:copper homeostasis protein CutC
MKVIHVFSATALAMCLSAGAYAQDRTIDPAAVQQILDRIDTLHVTSYREIDESQSTLTAELQAILDEAEQAEQPGEQEHAQDDD